MLLLGASEPEMKPNDSNGTAGSVQATISSNNNNSSSAAAASTAGSLANGQFVEGGVEEKFETDQVTKHLGILR